MLRTAHRLDPIRVRSSRSNWLDPPSAAHLRSRRLGAERTYLEKGLVDGRAGARGLNIIEYQHIPIYILYMYMNICLSMQFGGAREMDQMS